MVRLLPVEARQRVLAGVRDTPEALRPRWHVGLRLWLGTRHGVGGEP